MITGSFSCSLGQVFYVPFLRTHQDSCLNLPVLPSGTLHCPPLQSLVLPSADIGPQSCAILFHSFKPVVDGSGFLFFPQRCLLKATPVCEMPKPQHTRTSWALSPNVDLLLHRRGFLNTRHNSIPSHVDSSANTWKNIQKYESITCWNMKAW